MNSVSSVTGSEALPGVYAPTVCAAFQATARAFPDLLALRTPRDGMRLTWAQYAERVERTAAGLSALGIAHGDTVGLMLRNRPEFHWCDTAAMHLGAVCCSIYNTSSSEQIEYCFQDAATRVLITERAFLPTLADALPNCPSIKHLVVVDGGPADRHGALSLGELEAAGHPSFDFAAAWGAIQPEDLLVLIYTSGTSGPPKGVELTHANLMWEVRAFHDLFPAIASGKRIVSYLPMAHAAERCFSHYHAIPRAATVTCVDDPQDLVHALPEVRPSWFLGVPRVWEKLRAALTLGAGAATLHAIAAAAARAALELRSETVPADVSAAAEAAERDELRPLREAVGLDRVEIALVGGAPIAPEVVEFFAAFGTPLTEVWGMTELSAIVTVNHPENMRLGTVGQAFPGTELRIAEDGEILVRGPVVMHGYRNRPDAMAETIDPDGWLRTGDVGELDQDGFLRIVDRKKDLIINAGGKNMSPANIEARVKLECHLVAHVVAVGDRRPYNVALVVVDPVLADGRTAEDAGLREEIHGAVQRANGALSRIEQIKRLAILVEDWQPSSAQLTPTMKLRRRWIVQHYGELIDELYAASPPSQCVEVR
jgi:long-subunit acyl-CoA synthetase (AMP-forming)